MTDIEVLQRRLEREKQARQQAETILETKSLELFTANQKLQEAYEELRTFSLERERTLEALQESERRFRAVMQSAKDAIITADSRGNIVAWNKAAQVIFGYAEDEVMGKPLTLLMPPRYRAPHRWGLARVNVGGEPHLIGKTAEFRGRRKDGQEFPLELVLATWKTGEETFFTGFVRDITLRKQAEEKIRWHNEILEYTVQERTAELSRAKEAAEAASRAKSEFLANMSHELRTPLHGVLGFARRGLKRAANAPPAKLHDYFAQIEQSGESLLRLLNDLLDLAKLEAGKMTFTFEPGDLRVLLASVADEFHSLLSERDLTVQYCAPDEAVHVTLDAGKITQVLRNLLSNAIKFSPPGGTIALSMHQAARSIVVTIRDQGPGIPESEVETIFEKFVQSSQTKTGAGGTGLGLSICREIILAHEGRIWAENGPEGGTVFSFELPLRLDNEMHGSHRAAGAPGHTEMLPEESEIAHV